MISTLTTQELYNKKRKEYEDAQVEQRVYAKQLSDVSEAFRISLTEASEAIYATEDQDFIDRYNSLVADINQYGLIAEKISEYLVVLQNITVDLDTKARSILNA